MAIEEGAALGGATRDEGQGILGGPSAADVAAIGAAVDGIHEVEREANELFSEMNDSMKALYTELARVVPGLVDYFGDEQETKAREDLRKSSGKSSADFDDLSKLPDAYGLPGLFIGTLLSKKSSKDQSWLADISDVLHSSHGVLNTTYDRIAEIAEGIAGLSTPKGPTMELLKESKPTDDKKSDKKEKKDDSKAGGDKIRGALEGLIGTAKGLFSFSAAVIGFAGAAALFTVINWSKALVGLGYFAMFIAGTILISKFITEKEEKKLADFGRYVVGMTTGFLLFEIALLVLSFITPLVFSSFFGLVLVSGFFLAFSLLGALISKVAGKGMKDFAFGSLLLSIALIVFAAALVIIGKVVWPLINDPNVMEGIKWIRNTFLFFIFIGALASRASVEMRKFAGASILLTISLLVFAAGLVVIGRIVWPLISDPATIASIIGIVGFFALFIVLGMVASKAAPEFLKFAGASLLMSIALIAFSAGLVVVHKFVAPAILDPNFWLAIGSVVLLMAAFVGIGVAAGVAMLPILAFTGTSILLAIGLLAFCGSLLLFSKVIVPLMANAELLPATDKIVELFMAFSSVGGAATFALVGLIFLTMASVSLLASMIALSAGLVLYTKVVVPFLTDSNVQATSTLIDLFYDFGLAGYASMLAIPGLVFLSIASTALMTALVPLSASLLMFAALEKLNIAGAVATAEKVNSAIKAIKKIKMGLIETAKFTLMIPAAAALSLVVGSLASVSRNLRKLSESMRGLDAETTIAPISMLIDVVKGLDKLSMKQMRSAMETIDSMSPLVSSLSTIGYEISSIHNAAAGISNLKLLVEMVDELSLFAQRFKAGGIFSRSTAEEAKIADDALRSFIPMLKTLSEIEGMSRDFQGIRMNVEANVLAPLLALEPGVQKVKQLTGAFGELNRELAKLVKENGKALTQVTDLNKGNGAGFKFNLPFLGRNDKKEEAKSMVDDPIERIAVDVASIREKVTGERRSWMQGN